MKIYGFACCLMQTPKCLKVIKSLKGLNGIACGANTPFPIVTFKDLNDAKIARNELSSAGYASGNNIMNCEQTDNGLTVIDVAV